MSLVTAFAIYFVIWWIVLFAVLPWGVRSQHEDNSIVPGSPASAPRDPRILVKAAVTTIVALVIFGFVYWLLVYKPVGLDDIPLLPRFKSEGPG